MADDPPSRKARKNPSLLACIACRQAHVRCTGTGSICDRCTERRGTCIWVESRRGMRPSASSQAASSGSQVAQQRHQHPLQPQPAKHDSSRFEPIQQDAHHGHHSSTSRTESSSDSYGHDGSMLSSSSATSPGAQNSTNDVLLSRPNFANSFEATDPLLDLYYKYFHPSHPFVLPSTMRAKVPEFLKAVMRFGGSHFVPHTSREALKNVAIAQVIPNAPDNGFKIQAFALLAMISFSRNEQEEGGAYLKSAVSLALWLGLNQEQFAMRFGNGDHTTEESWRRTWWDTFVVEGLMSSFTGRMESSPLRDITTNVLLPGDCESYNACSPSKHLRSFEEMQDRAFSEDGFEWSSFAYKIEAMYLLRGVGVLGADSFAPTDSKVEILDQRLSNFRLSLPSDKRASLKANGEVDEVMFGALMTASIAEIALHRPRSSLVFIRNHYRTACTPEEVYGLTAVEYRSHDAKAVRAANDLTNLLTLPSPPILHTPCFTCALTVATTVQLPAMVQNRPTEGASFKERVQLAITAMGSISDVWPMALATKSQVASFARDVLKSSTSPILLGPPLGKVQENSVSSSSGLSIPLPLEDESYIENQDWYMELVAADSGLTASEVDAWLESTSDTNLG